MDNASRNIITDVIDWQGLSLSVTLDLDWSGLGDIAHLEIATIKPDGAPNPISATGYRSHFLPTDEINNAQELRLFVVAWLERAAKSANWKGPAQLSLF